MSGTGGSARTVCASGSATGSAAAATRAAIRDARAQLAGAKPDLALVFASPELDLGEVLAAAAEAAPKLEIAACTTAGELTERGLTQGGVAVMLTAWGEAQHALALAEAPGTNADELAEVLCSRADDKNWRRKHGACLLLGDGLSPMFEKLVVAMQKSPRHDQPFFGGGAADGFAFGSTRVGTNGRPCTGGMLAIRMESERPWGVGVAHGLHPASVVMSVSKASGNKLYDLNGRPALDVYREYAASRGVAFEDDKAPQFLVENELGVLLFDDIVRVRAPIRIEPDGALFMAGEVPEGSLVCIVRGSQEEIIAAARTAAEEALDGLGGAQPAGVLVFSCVCRAMVLGERYAEEIAAIRSVFRDVPVAGFSSYGEVARTKSKLAGYHNDTIVVAAIPE